jgi:diacylglycerol kinase (ATP)
MSGIAVIVNPTKFSDLDKAEASLTDQFANFGLTKSDFDWILTTAEDTGAGQTEKAVKDGAEMVLSWGGDGTVRAVAFGLLGSDVPMGILPGGTGNLIAKNLDLPTSLHGAVGVALGGGVKAIDINEVDLGDGVRRISLLISGMGLDAAVIDSPERLKAKLGAGAYAASAVKNLIGSAKPLTIQIDDDVTRRVSARMALVGNFGGMQMGVNLFDNADPTDGELAVFVAKLRGVREFMLTGKSVAVDQLFGGTAKGHRRLQLSGKRVEFTTTEPWPREIDGDLVEPGTYMGFKVLPAAVKIRVK